MIHRFQFRGIAPDPWTLRVELETEGEAPDPAGASRLIAAAMVLLAIAGGWSPRVVFEPSGLAAGGAYAPPEPAEKAPPRTL